MLERLSREDRLRLLRCIASLAWADGEVQELEREFLKGLMQRMQLGADETKLALGYLDVPPHPAEADPTRIPRDQREQFLTLAKGMISADSNRDPQELESLQALEHLLLG